MKADRLGQLCLVEVPPGAEDVVTTEKVARLVAVTPFIGRARDILEHAGHTTLMVGNRITVDDMVIATFIGGEFPRWVVVSIPGTSPTWVIGVEVAS